jgi:hypothetical protein
MRRFTVEPSVPAGERTIRRSITVSPKHGSTVVLRARRVTGPLASNAQQVPVEAVL